MALTTARRGLRPTGLRSMSRHTVDVSGQRHAVQVYRYADNLWIADGKVLGQQLRTIGRTAKKAVSAWQNAAVQKRRPHDSRLAC
jgi:hypothetical protein